MHEQKIKELSSLASQYIDAYNGFMGALEKDESSGYLKAKKNLKSSFRGVLLTGDFIDNVLTKIPGGVSSKTLAKAREQLTKQDPSKEDLIKPGTTVPKGLSDAITSFEAEFAKINSSDEYKQYRAAKQEFKHAVFDLLRSGEKINQEDIVKLNNDLQKEHPDDSKKGLAKIEEWGTRFDYDQKNASTSGGLRR